MLCPAGLLQFWFYTMKKHWFGCPPEIDELVFNTWKHNLDLDYEETYDIHANLSKIILYDQISRHILRYTNQQDKQSYYDSKALKIFETSGILSKLEELDEEKRCFALMPLRHTFLEHNLKICLDRVKYWIDQSMHPMYERFHQATVKALAQINNKKNLLYEKFVTDINVFCPVLDPAAPNNFMIPEVCVETKLANEFKRYCKLHNNQLIVSVSGGVDSMVCLYLARHCFPSAEIKAISINYANRPEQSIEIDMVNYICSKLNVKHYVRVINEIQRVRDSHREFYETITREIRFASYKNVSGDNTKVQVILGHNQDDTLENVFSNIKKGINYDNLFGMDHNSIEKDVCICRPLLCVPKSDIIKFANDHNIPYTYDSTPSWSERGRLRDILIPSIKSFDPNMLPGIIQMATNFKEIYQVYEKSIPKIYHSKGGKSCSITINNEIYILDYWKKILTNVALEFKIPFISNKSINHMITQLKINHRKNDELSRIILSKNLLVVVNLITNTFVFKLTK
jgi:tRNA(Ile)-lysidine synthetase-like protein